MKKLSEMTLEELWQLFPIILCEHKDCWSGWYEEERAALVCRLPVGAVINHIGSTSIAGIWAKPIVDILVETDSALIDAADKALLACGYTCMCAQPGRRDYNKGYTQQGFAERVFHLHLRAYGDNDEIYFRDYLRSHPDEARRYEALKLSLWKRYEHDRDGYTNAKGDFVTAVTERAKRERSEAL